MADTFRGYQVTKTDDGQQVKLTDLTDEDLMEGDVTVQVEFSALNYKDGLAMTGVAPVVRKFPLTPGIDFAGTVIESANDAYREGEKVVLNGFGVGEVHSGGFAGKARVRGEWLVKLPDGLSSWQAMAVGTAGYTSMLCVMALEQQGITPESGDVLVTGAAGGVGSVAVLLLSKLGYRVTAMTGRVSESDFLKSLGAAEVIDRAPYAEKARPLGKELWAAAVDVAGGNTLANVISQMTYGGTVAACGLADSMSLPTSVAPFILRGVSLCGVDSVMAPLEKRRTAWERIVADLDLEKLTSLTREIGLEEIPAEAQAILKGQVRGRTVVRV